ncbi:DUF397 domain-containing protein [Streptomyces acidiscabies]|uniref:DUF397 domain-containing protein n=1 Tax=Streptomyces acidiscabies TaxID=42234 RepID=A0AAP6EGN8_9ACTN|nr:DUF397 domain-containing protein [Streptomyces acidiscabies]MBP5937981.1 DUF397 domain-containing protein [Streptomyces sp. LBUM 1476]MBZ3908984.1 DUF397 domain-containing protein [Streptomyces acidiscabies]MDX2961520.1 DUF397 domain-containing protein [Streptomyces acidiscabies]MDX3016612.1 DUF397 domain-containing protein [Streptomyces acidiscabies]MDX3788483.1 DUF397 domain-containing protein [Streptomyces acidiscabies]
MDHLSGLEGWSAFVETAELPARIAVRDSKAPARSAPLSTFVTALNSGHLRLSPR